MLSTHLSRTTSIFLLTLICLSATTACAAVIITDPNTKYRDLITPTKDTIATVGQPLIVRWAPEEGVTGNMVVSLRLPTGDVYAFPVTVPYQSGRATINTSSCIGTGSNSATCLKIRQRINSHEFAVDAKYTKNGTATRMHYRGFRMRYPAGTTSCTLDGTTVTHGSSFRFFTSNPPPVSDTCAQSSSFRTCNNGVLSGNTVHRESTCSNRPVPPRPVAAPIGGTYPSARSVTLSSPNASFIRYSVNNTPPTCVTGALYTGSAISITSSLTLKAVACNALKEESAILTSAYTITTTATLPAAPTTPTPTMNATQIATTTNLAWDGGTGATRYGVWMGTNSTLGNADFKGYVTPQSYNPAANLPFNTLHYWKVAAVNAQGTTTGAVWSFRTQVVGGGGSLIPTLPVFSPAAGPVTTGSQITITSTNATSIHYTTNGTAPTCAIGTLYSGTTKPTITAATTLKAIGCTASAVSPVKTAQYTIVSLSTPSITPLTGTHKSPSLVRITSLGASSIHYTKNGTNPTCSTGSIYTTPFAQFTTATIKAVACNAAGTASAVASVEHTFNVAASCAYHDRWRFPDLSSPLSGPQIRCWDKNAYWSNPANGTPANPELEIIKLAPLPKMENDLRYPYHPVTIGYAMPRLAMLNQASDEIDGVKQFALPWANRCHWNTLERDGCFCKKRVNEPVSDTTCYGNAGKGNTYPYVPTLNPSTQRLEEKSFNFFYTSVKKADACTIAQTLALMGATEAKVKSIIDRANIGETVLLTMVKTPAELAAKIPLLDTQAEKIALLGSTWVNAYGNTDVNQRGPWIVNTCYVSALPGGPLSGIGSKFRGILLDYEVSDRRTPAQAASFLTSFSSEMKAQRPGIKLLLAPDPVTGAGEHAGITEESGPAIMAAFDGVPVLAQAGLHCAERFNGHIQSLEKQMRIWGGGNIPANKSKFMIQYSANNDQNIGKLIRTYALTNNIKYLIFTQAYIRQDTCNVSEAGNTPIARPVYHAKDLFGMPDPNSVAQTPTPSPWAQFASAAAATIDSPQIQALFAQLRALQARILELGGGSEPVQINTDAAPQTAIDY